MEGHTGRPDRPGEAAGAHRQRCVEIDGCLKRQNPAYRPACDTAFQSEGRDAVFFLSQFVLVFLVGTENNSMNTIRNTQKHEIAEGNFSCYTILFYIQGLFNDEM